MHYLAIDLEMTGLNVKTDRILEIGAIRMENGIPGATFSALIHPHCRLSEEITALTGITQEMAEQGEELTDVLPRFLDFAGQLPLLGHNLMFDYSFLKQAYVNQRLAFSADGIDTLKIARKLLPAEQKKSLTALRSYFSIHTETIHRAVDDAYAAACVYERLFADFGSEASSVFCPSPLRVNIKKQQPVTIPQTEQLTRLLSEQHLDLNTWLRTHESIGVNTQYTQISQLTRSEASRIIERLLHP